MDPETLRKIFKSPFDYKTYSNEIVHRLFGCVDVYKTIDNAEHLNPTQEGDQSYFLGQMEDADGRLLGFFYTRVAGGSDVRRKRVGLRKLIQPYLKYDVDAAIAVFDDGRHWRLSYICDHRENITSAKRFSYILGDEQGQYKTPIERLGKVAEKNSRFKLSDLREAFSVDALSKEFFDEYHRHYDIIINELKRQGFEGSTIHDYVKKMMGRIVFLHFLQKKGWLNGNLAFLRDLFFFSPHQGDFLEQVLEPLFFGIFNTENANREQLFKAKGWDMGLLEDWKELPYLNGGLFERDAVDEQNITLPSSLFEDLFTFMASYNFTVDENDPDDAEVGVDPEMLGKIFESLLEDNKAKGAFYTPKEIVRYMCKESLIAYLSSCVSKSPSPTGRDLVDLMNSSDSVGNDNRVSLTANGGNNLQDSQDFASETSRNIRRFVEQHEMQPELEPYRDTLDTALRNVKICDPAIGSGAFPMGLLNELWRCREALYAPSPMGRDLVNLVESNHAVGGISQQDQRDFVSAASRSKLKKEIIENNIYGVDIEKGAIDIARLRFWLSIVVDAEEPEPLPNFDYKFMQGNSLIESYKGINLSRISNRLRGGQSKSTQLLLGLDSDFSKKNLQLLIRDYFKTADHKQKSSMRQAINDEVKRLITDFIGGTAADLDKLDPSANQDFFLWHTWFKDIFDNGGFDIVIGNPPYGANIDSMIDEYNRLYPGVMNNIAEIYKLFFSLFITICRNNGFCILITPNTYLSQPRYKDLRTYLLKYKIVKIIDLSENVFDATVSTAVTLMSKSSNLCNIVYYDNKNNINLTAFESYPEYILDIESIKNSFDKSICIDLNPNISSKFLDEVFELKDAGIQYHRSNIGLKNKGGNDLYERIFSSDANHFQRCIPTWYGKKINRFYIDQDTDEYFNLDYRDVLKQNESVSFNIKAFNQPLKIIWRQTASYITATLDAKQRWFRNTIQCGYLKPEYIESVDYYYALSIFNSRYFRECYNKLVRESGRVFPQIKLTHLRKLPFVIASFEKQNELSELAKEIVKIKQCNPNADTSELEHQIDILVYKLYNLTPEEIAIIEQ